MALAGTGAQVIAIAGNHDHAATLDAYRPFAGAAGVTLVGSVRTAEQGGVVEFTSRGGEPVTVAVLPFLSQRYAVSAAELVTRTPAQNTAAYDQLLRDILGTLTAGFRTDAVNLVLAHLTVLNGAFGGGERAAQSIFEYAVPATVFPADAHYVALGHLHRRQRMAAPSPVHYCGSPLAVDFGEQENTPRRLPGRGHPDDTGARHRHPDRRGQAAADAARHRARAGRARRFRRRRLPARVRAGAGAGGAARGGHRPAAATRWRSGSTRSSPRRSRARGRQAVPGPNAARRSCSASTARRRRWPTRGSTRCSPGCTTARPAGPDAPGPAGDARLRRLPRARDGGLRRRGLLRSRRTDGLGEVHGDRRDDVRALRVGAPLGRPADGRTRDGAERQPRHGPARVRRRGRALRRRPRAAPFGTRQR